MAVAPLPLTVSDGVCVLDVDSFGGEVTSDLQALEQDVFHRLLETPGSNIDDPTLGIGVEQLLSGDTSNLRGITSRIEQQLEKDDRIDACAATLTPDTGPGAWILDIEIQVAGKVLSLSYTFSQSQGLQPS